MTTRELLHAILDVSHKNKYPDIHINTGKQAYTRNSSGEILRIEEIEIWDKKEKNPVLTKEIITDFIKIIAGEENKNKFLNELELDTSYDYEGRDRYRVNCYADTNGYSIAFRIIPKKVPTLEELWLWEQVKWMCGKAKGLILITWPTGAGKSTNMAAMIEYINENFAKHIITVEDPVEFTFESKKSLISQRELWNSTKSFEKAMKAMLREDPDVIVLWEMRDPETIKTAITLAETGHLVFSTLHTNDTVQTVDRIVDVFPSGQQEQIRMQLAMSLVWIISQRLLPRCDKEWRIPARELLINNDPVRNLIITGKTHQLYSVIEISQKEGMVLMDKYLLALYKKWVISKATLLSFARDKEILELAT